MLAFSQGVALHYSAICSDSETQQWRVEDECPAHDGICVLYPMDNCQLGCYRNHIILYVLLGSDLDNELQ